MDNRTKKKCCLNNKMECEHQGKIPNSKESAKRNKLGEDAENFQIKIMPRSTPQEISEKQNEVKICETPSKYKINIHETTHTIPAAEDDLRENANENMETNVSELSSENYTSISLNLKSNFNISKCLSSENLEIDSFYLSHVDDDSDFIHNVIENEHTEVHKNIESKLILCKNNNSHEMMTENDYLNLKYDFLSELLNVSENETNTSIVMNLEPQVKVTKSKRDKMNEFKYVSNPKVKITAASISRKVSAEEEKKEVSQKVAGKYLEEKSELQPEQSVNILLDVIQNLIDCELLSSDSIKIFQIISDFCSNKLKIVLESSIRYKNLWERKKLTIDDFQKGLILSGEKSLSNYFEFPIMEGRKKSLSLDLSLPGRKTKRIKLSNSIFKKSGEAQIYPEILPKLNLSISRSWLGWNESYSVDFSKLPNEMKVYFKLITKNILNFEGETCSIALNDLKHNKNISILIPHFIMFIVVELRDQSCDFARLSGLLKIIKYLFLNPNLYFVQDFYLIMIYILLKCLVDQFQPLNISWDNWLLKETAAELLSWVLKRSTSKKFWFEIMYILETALYDKHRLFSSHYGVLVALNLIGVLAIRHVLLLHIEEYFEHLYSFVGSEYEEQCNFYCVQGELINSFFLINCDYLKDKMEKSQHSCKKSHNFFNNYQEEKLSEVSLKIFSFAEYFGDSLVPCFLLLNFVSSYVGAKKNKIQISPRKKILSILKQKAFSKINKNKSVSFRKKSVFDYKPVNKRVIKFGNI